jgi:Tol biopolymer transport system component
MKTRTMKNLSSIVCLLIFASFSISSFAQNPDFSGKWKINDTKSELAAEFSFAPKSLTIAQESNLMTVERVSDFQGQEFISKSAYTLDGKESKNQGFQGRENVSVAQWSDDGQSLSIVTTIETQNGEMHIKGVYSMDQGNLVVVNGMEGGPMGDREPEKWVFDKQ